MSALDNFGSVFWVFLTVRLSSKRILSAWLIEESTNSFTFIFCEDMSNVRGLSGRKCEESFWDTKTHENWQRWPCCKNKADYNTERVNETCQKHEVEQKKQLVHRSDLQCEVTSFEEQNVFPSRQWVKHFRRSRDVEGDEETFAFYKLTSLQIFGQLTVIFLFTLLRFRKWG